MVFDSDDWDNGYTLFPISLTPDMSSSDNCGYISEQRGGGTLSLHIRYSKPLEKPIIILCILEFYQVLHIGTDKKPIWMK